MKNKGQKPNRKSWVTSQLRRLSMRWPPRNRVLKASRRELPRKIKKDGTPHKKPNYEYQCNKCKDWFRSSDTQMDHIIPVMNTTDSSNMTEAEYYAHFIPGLLCYEDNYQILCLSCHSSKTNIENQARFKKSLKSVIKKSKKNKKKT